MLNINTGKVESISEDQYREILNNNPQDPFTFVSNDITLRLFSIAPFSNYLPANFKHRYNGIYINDGTNNTRISRKITHLGANIIWLRDGKYVVSGSYIYDTSGRLKETKLIDGEILAIF